MVYWFMAFVLVWCVLGFWATSRKWPDLVAWGGGFVLSLLIIVGVFRLADSYTAYQKAHPRAESRQDAAINQARILDGLGAFAPALKSAPSADGRARALGKTQGGSSGLLEISGRSLEAEVEKATLAFPVKLDDDRVNALNLQMATRYIHALFPEWVSPETWLESNALTSKETKTVEREGRRITVKHSQELGLWFLTVEKL